MTEQQIPKLAASLVEHQNDFSQIPTEDAQWAIQNTVEAINLFAAVVKNRAKKIVSILRLISKNKKITIGATSGVKTIAQATDVFTWGIDSNFKNWGLDVSGEAKPETPIEVHEMVENGGFKTIFGSIGWNLDELCLTQEQIIVFVHDHKNVHDHKKWLRSDGFATFFLFKVDGEFFVADVHLHASGRMYAHVNRFLSADVLHGDRRHRVVVPRRPLSLRA